MTHCSRFSLWSFGTTADRASAKTSLYFRLWKLKGHKKHIKYIDIHINLNIQIHIHPHTHTYTITTTNTDWLTSKRCITIYSTKNGQINISLFILLGSTGLWHTLWFPESTYCLLIWKTVIYCTSTRSPLFSMFVDDLKYSVCSQLHYVLCLYQHFTVKKWTAQRILGRQQFTALTSVTLLL